MNRVSVLRMRNDYAVNGGRADISGVVISGLCIPSMHHAFLQIHFLLSVLGFYSTTYIKANLYTPKNLSCIGEYW